MRIIAIIPAHNEADQIAETVLSVVRQTRPVDRIVVVADNCTDDTVAVARAAGAEVMETVGNSARKAGAMNQAFDLYVGDAYDFVLQMDADTVLDRSFVAAALCEMDVRPLLGGVSGRFLTKPDKGFIRMLQRMEYERLDQHSAHARDAHHCLSGTAVLLRRRALPAWSPWREDSMVEDYALTLDMREAGWLDKRGDYTLAYTETKPTLATLWAQRVRWAKGTLDELHARGWSNVTRKAMLGQAWAYAVIACRFLWLSMLASMLVTGGSYRPSLIWLAPLPIIFLERVRSVWGLGWRARVIAATILGDEFYQLLWEANMLRSLYLAARRRSIAWEGGKLCTDEAHS